MASEERAARGAAVAVALIYGTIILTTLSGTDHDQSSVRWLLAGVVLVGVASCAVSGFNADSVARGLTLMAASQLAGGLVLVWHGVGRGWLVTTESVVLALIVAALARFVHLAARDD